MKAPFPEHEEQRIAKLFSYNILDSQSETAYDDLAQLAAYICQVPIALVSLVDTDRQWFKSAVGLEVKETHRDLAFCAHAILQPNPLVVPDAREDDRFADNLLVTGDPGIRFYAGTPLVTTDGMALGTLCVIDTHPRTLTVEQINALAALGRQVINQLELRISHQKLMQEIDERKRMEARLQQNHSLLDQILNNTTDLIFAKDLQGDYLMVNTAFASMFNTSVEQIIGQNNFSLLSAEAARKVEEDDRSVIESGISWTYEEEALVQGQWRAFSTTKAPIYDAAGDVVGIVGVARDISSRSQFEAERQQVEAELRLSEERYRSLMVAVAQIVWVTDPDGQTVDIPQWRAYTGQTIDEVKGLGWLAAVHPDDQEPTAEIWAEAVRTKSISALEYRIRGRDGNYRYFAVRGVPILNQDGSIREWVGICTDIDDRKRAEAQLREQEQFFRALYEGVEHTISIADVSEDGEFHFCGWNQVCEKATGIASKAIVGQTPEELLGEVNGKKVRQNYQRCIDTGNSICYEEYLPFQGQAMWWLTTVNPLKDETGRIYRLVITSFEITDRKQAEEALHYKAQQEQAKTQQLEHTLRELQHTQSQLVQAEKMSSLGQLVAGIAHEINNPVNFIYGNISPATSYAQDLLYLLSIYQQHYPQPQPALAQAIADVDLDFIQEDLPKLLASMKEGADRIRQIVLSLRNFSRMDEAEYKTVDIHEGIDSTLMILQNRLKAKPNRSGIEVIKSYGELPPIECYAGQLNQVFLNILTNAIDALEDVIVDHKQSDPQIQISTQLIDSNTVKISFADNGPGIPVEIQNRLFDPFFTTKPVGKGTGMGMAISYQIITEKHQGSLQCVSNPGQGGIFTIIIPIRQT